MCDFSVITRFDFHSLCNNDIRSRSVPFQFRWCVLPCCPWEEEVPWLCVGKAAVRGAKRPHAKEVLFDTFSLLPIRGETKPWGYGWGCSPWSQETTYQRGQYHANYEWVDPLTSLSRECGIFVINYLILDFMALELYC